MTSFIERRCRECSAGTIRLVARAGRTWPYKGLTLTVPADFAIPTCDHCGEEWLDPDRAEALDATLEGQYKERLLSRFREALAVLSAHESLTSLAGRGSAREQGGRLPGGLERQLRLERIEGGEHGGPVDRCSRAGLGR